MEKKLVKIIWNDSYGVSSGWQDIENYNANELLIESVGFVIDENEKTVALAHNYAKATELTPEQANGIMVIPKSCIVSTFVLTDIELELKLQHS